MKKIDPYKAMYKTRDAAQELAKDGMSAVPVLMVFCTWMLCCALHSCAEAICEAIRKEQ